MRVVNSTPPNYAELAQLFPLALERYVPLFPYGDTLYNPSGRDIPEDVMIHEEVHRRQQGEYPEVWWTRYAHDREFRLDQELEAYAAQYQWIRRSYPYSALVDAMFEFADNLSSPLYRLDLSFGEAEALLRRASRERSATN